MNTSIVLSVIAAIGTVRVGDSREIQNMILDVIRDLESLVNHL
jgi:hypothetical protein